jgi:hypothetical protein
MKIFTDQEVSYNTRLWNSLHSNYRFNTFFKNMFDRMIKNKKLTQNQWTEFEYLITKGRSRYEAGLLTTKH